MSPSSTRRVTDVTGRLERRRRQQWKRRGIIAAVVVAVLAIVAGLVWLVGFSSVLSSQQVEVVTPTLDKEEVARVAAVPMGVPLSRIDLKPAAARVAGMERVASVKVEPAWPHSVRIVVTERVPVFAVRSSDGHRLVDATGQAYGLDAKRPEKLPVARIPGVLEPAMLRDIATVVAQLPDNLNSGEITAPSADAITVTVPAEKGRREIVWGGPDQSELKRQVLETLMRAVPDAKVYDVSAPSRPTTR